MHDIQAFLDVRGRAVDIRGRLFAYPELEPEKTALVIVDMQNVFCAPGALVEVPEARDIVPNINSLTTAARAAGMPVVWLRHTSDKDTEQGWPVFFRFGMTPDRKDAYLDAMSLGAEGHQIYSGLEVADSDLIVDKRRFSGFAPGSSTLDTVLRERGIDNIIITGTLSNVCCESTARDAYFLNYGIIFPSDANACLSDDEHNATLVNMHSFFGDVRSTDDILTALQHNEHRFAES
ncbi:isochorismatase family cysteine hydrolase [Emcibacter sp.]|uniref:cysteine hydrolase family protein n=1 Tax=Emcibacter sp. TaxID=1979954 RepID=UPI002AA82F38|nr:isochorismatase family cysteine hydrolase [Emcibacter sp.]